MYEVQTLSALDDRWRDMTPLRIGRALAGQTIPDRYIGICEDGSPCLRVDVFHDGFDNPFNTAIPWGPYVLVANGELVHIVDPESHMERSISCEMYFGSFYEHGEILLIASATELFCVDRDMTILWHRTELGGDGVLVTDIEGDTVSARGQWDPPDGWRDFQLSLETGETIPA